MNILEKHINKEKELSDIEDEIKERRDYVEVKYGHDLESLLIKVSVAIGNGDSEDVGVLVTSADINIVSISKYEVHFTANLFFRTSPGVELPYGSLNDKMTIEELTEYKKQLN